MFLTATRIHDGHKWLPEGTVLEVGIDGSVLAMHESHPQAKHFDGVICPGFVNVHCHVELSHMKGKIPEHTGLIPFLKQVNFTRHAAWLPDMVEPAGK